MFLSRWNSIHQLQGHKPISQFELYYESYPVFVAVIVPSHWPNVFIPPTPSPLDNARHCRKACRNIDCECVQTFTMHRVTTVHNGSPDYNLNGVGSPKGSGNPSHVSYVNTPQCTEPSIREVDSLASSLANKRPQRNTHPPISDYGLI